MMPLNLAAATNAGVFTTLDWGVVVAYIALVMVIGLWFSRGQKTKRDYFLGGRNLSWWAVGFSIVATETSALTFIGIPAMAIGKFAVDKGVFTVAGGSLLFMMVVVGHVIGRIIIATVIVPYYFKGDVYTTYQLLSRAFGQKARYVAAGLSLVGASLSAGVRVYVTSIPVMFAMQSYYPWWGMAESIILIMIFAVIYTAIGGITAVVWTDMMQYFIFVGGGLYALWFIPSLLHGPLAAPSGATGWGAVYEVGKGTMNWWNSGFLTAAQLQEKLGPNPGFFAAVMEHIKNVFGGDFNIWMGLLAVPPGIVLALGFDQMNVQRVLCCKSAKQGSASVFMSAVLIPPQFLLFLLVGVCLYAFYTINGFDFGNFNPWLPSTVDPLTGIGTPKGDFIFPIFIMTHIPEVMKGFLLAAILAAAMSSVSSALSAMASIAIMDFYKPFSRSAHNEKFELMLSRIVTVGAGAVLGVVAWLSKASDRIFDLAFTLGALTAGAILGAFTFGMIKRRCYPGPIIAGMVASFFFMLLFNFILSQTKIAINWTWHAPIGTLVCLAVAWLASIGVPRPEGGDITTVEKEGH